MDPVTWTLLAACLLAYGAKKVVGDSIVDNNYAKQGLVSPRFEAQHGRAAAAKAAKYGFFDYLRDNWRDYWAKAAEADMAARDVQPRIPGERVPLRDRWVQMKGVLSRGVATVVDPVGARARPEPPAPPVLATDSGDVDPDTVRINPDGTREQWDGRQWRPVVDEPPAAAPQPTPETNPGGIPMTAPTGEAVNYETTVNELEAIAKEQQGQIDSARQALDSAAAMKSAIDGMQQSYNATAAAAQSVNDHLQALHLDADTLGHVGTVGDAMPAGAVDAMYDRIEEIEAAAKEQLENAEIALASTEAALSTVIGKYGDANATVQGELGGDATFLHGGGAAGSGTAAVPMAAPTGRHAAPTGQPS